MTVKRIALGITSKFLKAGIALLRTVFLVLAASGAPSTWASGCNPYFGQDAEWVAERLGSVDVVFVGKIQQVGTTVIYGNWSASIRALVIVERVFKGELKGVVEIYLDLDADRSMIPGKRLILYATREAEHEVRYRLANIPPTTTGNAPERSAVPALRADGQCAPRRRWAPADEPWGLAELQHLDNLPKPGSGGTLKLELHVPTSAKWLGSKKIGQENLSVAVSAGNLIFRANADNKGVFTFLNLPAGVYKLAIPQVPGFSVDCGYDAACDKLKVTDRGLHRYTAEYEPNAFLDVRLARSDGVAIDTAVAFQLTRVDLPAANRERPFQAPSAVQFITNSVGSKTSEHSSRDVGIPSGKYTLALLLTQNKKVKASEDEKYASVKEISRQIVTSPNLGVLDLRAGDNAIIFKLPSTIEPVSVRFVAQFPRGTVDGRASYSAQLVQLDARGSREYFYDRKSTPMKAGDAEFFTALPGQTWMLSAADEKHKLEARQIVVVKPDAKFVLKMKKVAR